MWSEVSCPPSQQFCRDSFLNHQLKQNSDLKQVTYLFIHLLCYVLLLPLITNKLFFFVSSEMLIRKGQGGDLEVVSISTIIQLAGNPLSPNSAKHLISPYSIST